ncbi:MAG: DUF5309 domain-containing protein [Sphingosinicella sp.]|nr:DUF5309 domain-containing protein [Sphingosinicella sp.]
MAKLTGTYVTTEAKGIREDLTDMIYQISPTKTPFLSMIGRTKASNTLHEWQEDALATPDLNNNRPEGNEAAFTSPAPTVRLGNYVQISDKTAIVSGTLEAVDKAGRKSEMSKQLAKRSAELKRDMEAIALSNQPASGSDPRKTAGLPAWLKTNDVFGAGGASPVYTTLPNAARTDGTQAPFTEAMLKSAISLGWDEGAEPNVILAGSFNKSAFSAFLGIADQVYNLNAAKPGTIVASADVYVSNFGTLRVVPSRFQRARDVFLIDPEYMSIMYLRPFSTKPLAKTGDAEKRLINVEWGLKVHTEKAHAAVYDLTTA